MMFSVMVGTVNSNDAYETDELERIGAARYMPYGDKFILIFIPAAWGKYWYVRGNTAFNRYWDWNPTFASIPERLSHNSR